MMIRIPLPITVHLGMFALCVFLDFAFARWTLAIVARRIKASMAWSGAYYAVAMSATLMLVQAPNTLAAGVAGHMVGSWLSLRKRLA